MRCCLPKRSFTGEKAETILSSCLNHTQATVRLFSNSQDISLLNSQGLRLWPFDFSLLNVHRQSYSNACSSFLYPHGHFCEQESNYLWDLSLSCRSKNKQTNACEQQPEEPAISMNSSGAERKPLTSDAFILIMEKGSLWLQTDPVLPYVYNITRS